jgi:hypothetical protein
LTLFLGLAKLYVSVGSSDSSEPEPSTLPPAPSPPSP